MINVTPFVGLQFKEKGRTIAGYDCWGLVLMVLQREYGITGLPDFASNYSDTGDWRQIGKCISKEKNNWTKIDKPKEGAVIVFNMKGRPHHVGIITGKQKGKWWFLHVHEKINVKHERLSSSIWENRINAIYEY